MARLVSGVIDSARDRNAAFDPKRQPPGPLYRFLAEYSQELQGKILAIDSAYSGFETTLTYQLPLDDFDAGLALGAHRIVSEILYVDPGSVAVPGTYPVDLIHRDQRHAYNRPGVFAWQEGDRLYLGGPGSDWARLTGTIQVRVAQAFNDASVAALLQATAELPLPDEFATAVIEALAAFMGRRASPPIDLTAIAAKAEADALYSFSQRLVGTVVFTKDEWRP